MALSGSMLAAGVSVFVESKGRPLGMYASLKRSLPAFRGRCRRREKLLFCGAVSRSYMVSGPALCAMKTAGSALQMLKNW